MIQRGVESRSDTGVLKHLRLKRMLVINIFILSVILYGLVGEYLRSREMNKVIVKLDTQAGTIEEKNGELVRLSGETSSEAILEREARIKLNLMKPGEQVVIVRGLIGADQVTETTAVAAQTGYLANPLRWWHYFFK